MRSSTLLSAFADIGLADRPAVGGKGASLGELERAGIAVPPGFVVRTEAFEALLRALERESPIRAQVESLNADDLPGIIACSKALCARIEQAPLPAAVEAEALSAHAALCAGSPLAVAVRSSATTEDAAEQFLGGETVEEVLLVRRAFIGIAG